jgi:SAM-dependent methyltransferase
VIEILRGAGLFASAGELRSLEEVMGAARIKPEFGNLVRRWLDRLVAKGLLRFDGGAFSAIAALPKCETKAVWAEAERLFTDNQDLLRYVRHCSDLLEQVLRGDESPLETLFPQGSFDLAEALYERSTTMRYMNALAAAAMEPLSRMIPPGRALRILEVGAGTGGTTASLLPILAEAEVQYWFTDVSDLFLSRAKERFANRKFMTYRRFDIDQSPEEQEYAAGSFDVIVSANAVHASTDLRQALRRLHELLAPGGVLILIESTCHYAWFDITTGLIEGWRHFSDDLRTDNPLLSADRWLEALCDAGFMAAKAWPKSGSPADQLGQHVLVARVIGEPVLGVATTETSNASGPVESGPQLAAVDSFKLRVLKAIPADRLDLMREFVREQVMRVLRLDAAAPPGRHERLMDLGFDSMMAVQLRSSLAKHLQSEHLLPATLVFDYPTIDELARYLLHRVTATRGPVAEVKQQVVAQQDVLGIAAVAALTDAEIEARLLERLGKS